MIYIYIIIIIPSEYKQSRFKINLIVKISIQCNLMIQSTIKNEKVHIVINKLETDI